MELIPDDQLTDRDRALMAQGDGLYHVPVRTPDGGLSCVAKFIYIWAILHDLSDTGYDDRWCFETPILATLALLDWSGQAGTEPHGWHRHPVSGRRRPHGDATSEYSNL